MKKIIALVLCLVMVFALCACGEETRHGDVRFALQRRPGN